MELIFIILGIIAALSGFFKDNQDSDTGKPKRGNNQPQPTPFPSGAGNGNGGRQREQKPQSTVATESIEETQYDQRKQLAERMNTAENQTQTQKYGHDAIMDHNTREPGNDLSIEKKRMKKQMNRNLTRSGLINGVIMSEVLGQPRAVRPYRSIIAERKR
ncbi:hypothetical protein [Lentibacillus sp. CBA3610]|uniref:hypothetical protein n=1 Tax=Lentibacillus sp. CBA3610 TaxID=2518176 RepID=UPI001595A2B9|nr:hypothetical protein [Lentibacillus sp. CBA3610]QKY69493.1 hypothetical protein Len3610_07700 [Lentibacillus sp. CBA3610]